MTAAPKVIRGETEYDAALARISALLDTTVPAEIDELETWSVLVEEYESRVHAIEDLSGAAFLSAFMADAGYTQSDLARLIGSSSRAAEILGGRRELSKAMIRRLVAQWRLPAKALLAVELERAA